MTQYDRFARAYAAHSSSSPYNTEYERPAMFAQLPDISGKHVLDAACASGEYIPFLLERGARITAVDSSDTFVEIVRERFDDRVVTLTADLENGLPLLADECVDVILSSLTLHYIEDWDKLFVEFRRLLKPGGTLLLSTHHPSMTAPLVKNYFAVERVTDRWPIGGEEVEVTFFHRPLQAMIAPLIAAGLQLSAILEPEYAGKPGEPWFMILKAVRPLGPSTSSG